MTPRSSPGGRLSIAAVTKKIDVDNRISLRYYYRIADNILKQAHIFREEKNVIDLYVMLLRFSSLVTETIPCHQEYRTSPQNSKIYLKRKLTTAISELEVLKPAVQEKLQELQYKQIYQLNKQQKSSQNETLEPSAEWPAMIRNSNYYSGKQSLQPISNQYGRQVPNALSLSKPTTEHIQRISLSIPRPKQETLSKHSILGPNGLHGEWQPPTNYKVQYPSNLDLTPLQVPMAISSQNSVENGILMKEEYGCSEQKKPSLESVVLPKTDNHHIQESNSLISFEDESASQIEVIRQPSLPPILADVHDLIPESTPAAHKESGLQNDSSEALVCTEDPLQLHIPTELMNSFMKLAKSNTNKNLETCGVLAGSLKNRKFYITALIIPKQESTSDSCQTTNEEEIFEVQDNQSLFPLGWIHTHPTQSCFMSSIDVHTHYSYQIMLPEAIAIVMAPRDSSRTHGIFRLTSGGMTVIRHCPRRGFHSHDPTADGTPIYRQCTDFYMNSTLKFDVIDLR